MVLLCNYEYSYCKEYCIQIVNVDEWISNALYYCNSVGEKIRTEMLIEDLRNASIIEKESRK